MIKYKDKEHQFYIVTDEQSVFTDTWLDYSRDMESKGKAEEISREACIRKFINDNKAVYVED